MKQQWARILLGVLLILAGRGYAGDVMGFWHFDLFFAGWWSLFIIIPCLVSIVENGFDTGNSLGLVFGLMLLFSAQGILSWHRMIQLLFPALLIILGIGLLARPRQVPVPAGEVPPADLSHAPELSAVFSQETRRIANTITGGAPSHRGLWFSDGGSAGRRHRPGYSAGNHRRFRLRSFALAGKHSGLHQGRLPVWPHPQPDALRFAGKLPLKSIWMPPMCLAPLMYSLEA